MTNARDEIRTPFGKNSTSNDIADFWRRVAEVYGEEKTYKYLAARPNYQTSLSILADEDWHKVVYARLRREAPLQHAETAVSSLALELPALALSVFVESGEKTDEGRLIVSVAPAWLGILSQLKTNPQVLLQLDPRQFEELVAGGYRNTGWEVTLTARSGDGGRDIIATRDDVGSIRILDQVKRYKPGHLVNAEEVRAMFGVLARDSRASKACITTTSDFAPGVWTEFADAMPTRLDLRNGDALISWLMSAAKSLSDERWRPPGPKVQPPTPRPRGEELWRLEPEGHIASCELRNDTSIGAGFEVIVRHDGEIKFGRRCRSEAEAQYYGLAWKQDYARIGWKWWRNQ